MAVRCVAVSGNRPSTTPRTCCVGLFSPVGLPERRMYAGSGEVTKVGFGEVCELVLNFATNRHTVGVRNEHLEDV